VTTAPLCGRLSRVPALICDAVHQRRIDALLRGKAAVVTLLAVCGSTHRESYLNIVMVAIVGALLGLVAVIGLGTTFGSF